LYSRRPLSETLYGQNFSPFDVIHADFASNPTSYHMGKVGRDMKLTLHFYLVSRSKIVRKYLHSPIRLHGVVLIIHRNKFTFTYFVYFLLLYSPILGLGRLHETFRFISVTRSRTVGRTPLMGDQLVARPLLTAPGDCDDDGEVGGMNGFGKGNRNSRRKPAPTPLSLPQIPVTRPGHEPRPPRKPATNRFSYGMAHSSYRFSVSHVIVFTLHLPLT
jgi:hypothetical protein